MQEKSTIQSRMTAGGLAIVGLFAGVVSTLYIAGTFGLSTATATNIVNAYEVGGWALTIALAVFSGGTAAALLAVLRKYAEHMGRTSHLNSAAC